MCLGGFSLPFSQKKNKERKDRVPTRASFRKGVQVPIGVPAGKVWGRVQVRGGGWLSCGKKGGGEKRKGMGRVGGWGRTGKGTGKSIRTRLSKLPFSKLPSRFLPQKSQFGFLLSLSCATGSATTGSTSNQLPRRTPKLSDLVGVK